MLYLLLVILVAGLILWLIHTYVTLPQPIHMLINVLVVVAVIYYALVVLFGPVATWGPHPR